MTAASTFAWDRRGIVAVLLLIVISQLFWIPLALLTATPNEFVGSSSFSPWFANWLVTAFALILLQRKTRSIPKSLKDASRIDALGPIGTWRHVVLPFVRRDLLLLTILLTMALLAAFWHYIHFPDDMTQFIIVVQRMETLRQHLGLIISACLAGAVPLMGLLLLEVRTK